MKTFLRLLTIACAIVVTTDLFGETINEDSVYSTLAEIQTVDSLIVSPSQNGQANRLEQRTDATAGYCQYGARSQREVYSGLIPSAYNKLIEMPTSQESILEVSDEFTEMKPRRFQLIKYQYEIPEVKEDELPFINKRGDVERNYGILLSAEWCKPCKRMYKVVAKLREEGFRIYVLDVDAFPKIKDKLNRLAKNPKAPRIGEGVPWFIVRDKGRTVKMFQGFTNTEKICPHLRPYKEQLQADKPDYDFVSEINDNDTED